jgi:hypothetical protein
MAMHIRKEVPAGDVPVEFMKQALADLEAAETLNTLMCGAAWASNYYRGQAVLWLTFHAVELFLKGCILKLSPTAKVNGHSLAALTMKLRKLAPKTNFDPPFGVEALPPYPELTKAAEEQERKIHEVLRYPIDTQGKPWPGVRGFSAPSFRRTLAQVRKDCERLYEQVFEGKDG